MRRLGFLFLLASAPGCGPDPHDPVDGPVEEQRCIGGTRGDGPRGVRLVEVGDGAGESFRVWADGQEVTMVTGPQGGTMVTPTVRVPAEPDDEVAPCWRVHIVNDMPGVDDVGPGILADVPFDRVGDDLEAATLPDLLGFDPEDYAGRDLVLHVAVVGDDFDGARDLTIRLR